MMLPRLNAPEVLPKRQASNYVKRRQIKPHYHIRPPLLLSRLAHLIHEAVDTLGDEGLLGAEGAVGEGAAQILAHLGVGGWVALANNGEGFGGEVAAVVELALDEGLDAFADAVDVAPGVRSAEAELVGSHTDDGAWDEVLVFGQFSCHHGAFRMPCTIFFVQI